MTCQEVFQSVNRKYGKVEIPACLLNRIPEAPSSRSTGSRRTSPKQTAEPKIPNPNKYRRLFEIAQMAAKPEKKIPQAGDEAPTHAKKNPAPITLIRELILEVTVTSKSKPK